MEATEGQLVIDTDILVDLLRGVEKTVAFISEFEEKGLTLSTTIINAFELFYGAYKSRKRLQNIAATRKLLERMIILQMELKSAEKAGQIHAELEAEGRPIGIRDVMIGAVVAEKGYTLITRNLEHLQKIKGLNLMPAP